MELSVIILNWNAAQDTVGCVREVCAWEDIEAQIWIVDNASSDDSVDIISRECATAHLTRCEANLGFAGGNNRGIREALSTSNAPILLLNNDASIAQSDVTRLLEDLHTDERIGLIGPLLLDAGDGERLLSAGGRDPVLHHHSHILELTPGEPIRAVEYVPGTVLLIRPEVFQAVGLLDEDYFFSMEVADLCKRAKRAGYLSVIDTRAHAFHDLDRSSEIRETLHTYYIIRNRFLFARKFYPNRKTLLYGIWGAYSLALSVKVRLSGKRAMARAVLTGLLDGLRGRFGGQNKHVLSRSDQSDVLSPERSG
jgi:hypothetical protein